MISLLVLSCRRQVSLRSYPVIKIDFNSVALHVIMTISLNSGCEDRETAALLTCKK